MTRIAHGFKSSFYLQTGGPVGGRILDDIWVHPQLVDFALLDRIRDVLLGRSPRLALSDAEIKALRGKWRNPDENQKYKDF